MAKKYGKLGVSTHSRLKAAGLDGYEGGKDWTVSTHSRLKAAGTGNIIDEEGLGGFNTQPPEGGWASIPIMHLPVHCFNTQPPEGGWPYE